MEKTCSRCRYWSKETDGSYPAHLGIGKCERVRLFWDCTEWNESSGDYRREFTKEAEGNKAFVQDASDYRAELITRPDFGCVQFEE